MKINNVLVNWSLFDEELLEPYEWKEDDDLEVIQEIEIKHVDEIVLNDLFNNIITLNTEDLPHEFIAANENYAIAVEMDHKGQLKYRSVLTYDKRNELSKIIKTLPTSRLLYSIEDYCENKEYGLTRNERIKKQYTLQKLDLLYKYQPKKLLSMINQITGNHLNTVESAYQRLQLQLKYGYNATHEYLYKVLYLI